MDNIYLYSFRLAVLKSHIVLPENLSIGSIIPVEEWKRCQFARLDHYLNVVNLLTSKLFGITIF